MRRTVVLGAGLLALSMPGVANATVKSVVAYCRTDVNSKVLTNVAPVTVNVDLSMGGDFDTIRKIKSKIATAASPILYERGVKWDTLGCRFYDPTLPYSDGNLPLDELENEIRRQLASGYRLVNVDSFNQPNAPQKGVPTPRMAVKAVPPPPVATLKGPTPNQLKYQRELEAYNRRLEEIEALKKQTAEQQAAKQAAAKQILAQHNQDMARHQREVAAAEAEKRRYEQELADHQRLVEQMRTKQEKNALVDWREAVVVCLLDSNDPQSKFGNWRCDGPLQFTYAKLGSDGGTPNPQALTALSEACGSTREAIRDLGIAAGARLFGCSFGLHPNATSGFHLDAAAKHGIDYVPGRAIYRCPVSVTYCRTK